MYCAFGCSDKTECIDLKKIQWMGNFKIIDAQVAKMINNFKNAKQKLLKTNAAMWFNQICRLNQLTPKYMQLICLV